MRNGAAHFDSAPAARGSGRVAWSPSEIEAEGRGALPGPGPLPANEPARDGRLALGRLRRPKGEPTGGRPGAVAPESPWRAATDPGAETLAERSFSRRFLLVLALEVGAIAVAANLLSSTGRAAGIVAAIAAIVAVGFFALGRAVEYGLYYITGAVQVALVAVITVAMRTQLERADALFGLAIGLTLWLTVVVTLAQGAKWSARLPRAAKST